MTMIKILKKKITILIVQNLQIIKILAYGLRKIYYTDKLAKEIIPYEIN